VPGVVTVSGPFDLDDLRAEVGKELRAPRSREHAAEVENLDAFERLQ
jgi:hypothetical protein